MKIKLVNLNSWKENYGMQNGDVYDVIELDGRSVIIDAPKSKGVVVSKSEFEVIEE